MGPDKTFCAKRTFVGEIFFVAPTNDYYCLTRLIFNLIHIPSPFREKVKMRVILNLKTNLVDCYFNPY
jgi:hypothetical protein